jgi:hypothetical protein
MEEVTKMEQLRQHPEIIDPYRIGLSTFADTSFVKDLGLDALLESVPFYSAETRTLARKVIADMGSDMNTVHYRQDALQDLVSTESLLDSIQRIVKLLNEMVYWALYFIGEPSLTRGIRVLRDYRSFRI